MLSSGWGALGQVAVPLWTPRFLPGKGQRIAEDGGGGAETKHRSPWKELLLSFYFPFFRPSFSQPLGRGKPGGFFSFHNLITALHLWSAECMPNLSEKVPALCGPVVLAPCW